MPDRFDPDDAPHFAPADPKTQEELGGVLERAFARERGGDPNETESRRLHALADEALAKAESKLSLAREAEAAVKRAAERYGISGEISDLADADKWSKVAEGYRREARELQTEAELLRQRIV